MPRRRSMSIESVRVVPASTLPSSLMAPASNSRRSVRLVLPASTCARIPRLSVCKGQLLQESGRDCQRCSRRPHRSYPLEKIVTDDQLPRSPESFRNRFSMPGLKGPAKLSMSPDPFVVRLDEPKERLGVTPTGWRTMMYSTSYQMYKYEHGLTAAEQRAADVR